MKRKIVYICIMCLLSFQDIYSQNHIQEIDLGSISPQWTHVTIDSLTIDSIDFDGTSHLFPGQSLRLNDTILIREFRDSGLDLLDGNYFEAINLKTGAIIWKNGYNTLTTGERSFMRHFFINDAGNLELLSQRRISDSTFFDFGKTQIEIREFDILTGELLRHFYNPMYIEEEILFFQLYKNDLYKVADKYVYFDDNTHSYLYEKECKRFDLDGNFIDSLFVSRPLKHKTWYGRNMWQLEDGSLMTCRYSVAQDISDSLTSAGFDDNEFIVDFYNQDLEHTDSLFLQEKPPYNWRKVLYPLSEEYFAINSYDSSFVNSYKEYFAYSVYNFIGEHIVTFDYKNEEIESYSIRQIPNTEQFLSFTAIPTVGEKTKWVFQLGDSSGDVRILTEIEIPDERWIQIRDMHILLDGSIVFSYYTYYDDIDGIERAISGMFSLGPSIIGLSRTEIIGQEVSINIYPNPAKNYLNVEWEDDLESIVIVKIIDVQSRVWLENILDKALNIKKMEINIEQLPMGTYYVIFIDEKGREYSKNFIKI